MEFSQGQIVVHPHHGPATVTEITTRMIRNEPRQYLKLEVLHSNLVVGVPLASAEEVGVRPVLDADALRDVFAILTAPSGFQENGWSRRIKANLDRLRTGDVETIAGLVRDLARRLEEKGLSLGEKDLLRDARQPLAAEIAVALSVTEAEVDVLIDDAIHQGTVPLPTEPLVAG